MGHPADDDIFTAQDSKLAFEHKIVTLNHAATRDLIDQYVEMVIIRSQAVEVSIASLEADHANEASAQAETSASGDRATDPPRTTTIKLPWSAPSFVVIKGIVPAPSTTSKMNPHRGEALLNAMAKARRWVE